MEASWEKTDDKLTLSELTEVLKRQVELSRVVIEKNKEYLSSFV